MNSVWKNSLNVPGFGKLQQDISTDVLIIGAGMAGILCAHMLARSGVDCVIAEAGTVCSGVTRNTTAKITSQHGLIFDKLIKRFGVEKARKYLTANNMAVEKYREMAKSIDCDFENCDSYVYSVSNAKKLDRELKALEKLDYHAELADELLLPFTTVGAVKFMNQAQFNPTKFISALIPSLRIYENTPVREISEHTVLCDGHKITAEKIIVTTHFPFINKHGSYFLKMYQSRSYVIALENAQQMYGMYIDEKENGLSFRNYENLLFIGGGGHRTGKNGGNWSELEYFARRYYGDAKIKYRWAAQDCMTLDGVPYIGNYSKSTPNLYTATGFNKWGMTSSMVAATLLTDLVTGRENDFADVFSPSRTILRPQLAVNGFETVTNLLTPSTKRCPHLGCALKWNAAEHSWDCPCHGSRFTDDGKLINNPATGDLKSD